MLSIGGFLFLAAAVLVLAWLGERRARLIEDDPLRFAGEQERRREREDFARRIGDWEAQLAAMATREEGMEMVGGEEMARLRSGVEALHTKVEALQRAIEEIRERADGRRGEPSGEPEVDAEQTVVRHLEGCGYERVRVVVSPEGGEPTAGSVPTSSPTRVGTSVPTASSPLGTSVPTASSPLGTRWIVEARRRGMTFKGKVEVVDGRVTKLDLTPGVHVFP